MLTGAQRAAWLAARRKGITGTDIAAILGVSPWRTALDVYLEKRGEAAPVPVTEAMWWGTYLEQGIARRYAELLQVGRSDVRRGAAIARCFPARRARVFGSGAGAHVLVRHPQHACLLGTFDALVPALGRGAEFKAVSDSAADEWGDQGTDQIPAHYLVQCAAYMAIAEQPRWDVAAIIGAGARVSGTLALYQVERNAALEAEITDAAVRFWRGHVLAGVPPAVDGSESWRRYLATRYQRGTGIVLRATPQVTALAARYREAQTRRQAAERDELLIRNQLAAVLRSADRARGPFGSIGWVRPGPKSVTDWETLARSLHPAPAVLARYTYTAQDAAYLRAWWARTAETDGTR